MKHYDGPAFYRKDEEPLKQTKQSVRKSHRKPLITKRHSENVPFLKPKSEQSVTNSSNFTTTASEQFSQRSSRPLTSSETESKNSDLLKNATAPASTSVSESNQPPVILEEKNNQLLADKNPLPAEPVKQANSEEVVRPLVTSNPQPKIEVASDPGFSTEAHFAARQIEQKSLTADGGSSLEEKSPDPVGYQFPPVGLLKPPVKLDADSQSEWLQTQVKSLDEALSAFGVNAKVANWTVGPTVTQFQVELGRGVKVNKITNLADDLKLQLAAKDIRIEAPIPGKSSVGIEVPNFKSRPVMLSEVLNAPVFAQSESPLTIALGVDLFGKPRVYDLRKMPHGLIAGATGSGKSVFINSLLISILYKATPRQVRLLLIDPKTVELAPYNDLPHLLAPVISDPKSASAALKWVTNEMDERYEKLAAAGVRNIEQYNTKAETTGHAADYLPYIVVIIDELADLMMVASSEVQDYIVRITQKARAAGIHLIIATQRPSVDVVTGLIKNNIPTRVAFMVSSQIDSRTILDHSGAERLLGRGDMLFLGNGDSTPIRLQGSYVDGEIDQITDFIRAESTPHYEFDPESLKKQVQETDEQDDLMPDVLEYLAEEDTISASKLQRVFSIGYNHAATIIDQLEAQGDISEAKGSKPREVYFTQADLKKIHDSQA